MLSFTVVNINTTNVDDVQDSKIVKGVQEKATVCTACPITVKSPLVMYLGSAQRSNELKKLLVLDSFPTLMAGMTYALWADSVLSLNKDTTHNRPIIQKVMRLMSFHMVLQENPSIILKLPILIRITKNKKYIYLFHICFFWECSSYTYSKYYGHAYYEKVKKSHRKH